VITKGEPTPNWPVAKTSITEAGANNKHALVRGAIPRVHISNLITNGCGGWLHGAEGPVGR